MYQPARDLDLPHVRLPIRQLTIDPNPSQQARNRFVVMVPPVVVVDLRRAAEVSVQDHQRRVQQPLGLEAREQYPHRLVQDRGLVRCPLEVVAVASYESVIERTSLGRDSHPCWIGCVRERR